MGLREGSGGNIEGEGAEMEGEGSGCIIFWEGVKVFKMGGILGDGVIFWELFKRLDAVLRFYPHFSTFSHSCDFTCH